MYFDDELLDENLISEDSENENTTDDSIDSFDSSSFEEVDELITDFSDSVSSDSVESVLAESDDIFKEEYNEFYYSVSVDSIDYTEQLDNINNNLVLVNDSVSSNEVIYDYNYNAVSVFLLSAILVLLGFIILTRRI